MKLYSAFFILVTVSEILFSIIYLLIKRSFDHILFIGLVIYLAVMLAGFISWKIARYNKKKRALLDSLPE